MSLDIDTVRGSPASALSTRVFTGHTGIQIVSESHEETQGGKEPRLTRHELTASWPDSSYERGTHHGSRFRAS